jgi:hypothetical protein
VNHINSVLIDGAKDIEHEPLRQYIFQYIYQKEADDVKMKQIEEAIVFEFVDTDEEIQEEEDVLIDAGSDRLEQTEELIIVDDEPSLELEHAGNEMILEQDAPVVLQDEAIPTIVYNTDDPDEGSFIIL